MPLCWRPSWSWVCCRSACNRSNGSPSGSRLCPQSTDIPVRLRAARVGRGQHARGQCGELVCDRPGTDLVGERRCVIVDSAARSGFLKAAMMSVASEDKTTVAGIAFSDLRSAARRNARENSARRLVAHTWILTARLLRRWSRDPATVLESLIMPVLLLVTVNIVLGDGSFAAHRAQRSLWQRPAARDGRGHVRVNGRRHQSHA